MEKQVNGAETERLNNSAYTAENFKNEISSMDHGQLNQTLKKLNFLALNLDPYNSSELTLEEETILEQYQLTELLANPFEFTNKLLKLIDLTQEETKKRFH